MPVGGKGFTNTLVSEMEVILTQRVILVKRMEVEAQPAFFQSVVSIFRFLRAHFLVSDCSLYPKRDVSRSLWREESHLFKVDIPICSSPPSTERTPMMK